MGTNLDKTKKAIGVESIDDKDRQDMFKKFQSAGGKVIKEKENPIPQQPKNKNSGGGKSGNSGKDSKSSGSSSSRADYKYANEAYDFDPKSTKALSAMQDSEMGNFLNRIIIKFKCWANNTTSFGNSNLVPQFMSEVNIELRAALMELKIAGNELLGNPELSPKLTKSLDKISPLFVELIGRGSKIFDTKEMSELLDEYNSNPEASVSIKAVAKPLYSIFRKLYYLYPFQATYKKALTAAYDTLQRLENKPSLIYNTKKKKSISEVSVVFDKMFEKIYLAVIRNEQKNIPMISLYMESLLNIQEDERPGKRKAGEELSAMAGGEVPEEAPVEVVVEEKPEEVLSPELSLGMKLMMETPIENLRKKHDPRNDLAEIPDVDKCFLTYLFFKEFDYEYSVVMTTKKILIQPTTANGTKVDNKAKLLAIYELSRTCMDQFKIYIETAREYFKAKANPGSNYIEYSKKLTTMEQRRGQQSRNTRAVIRDYIEKAKEAFEMLLNDMNGEKLIVANMEELLTFDSVETKKKLNRKQIKQCIMEAFCYTLAFSSRLMEDKGDLYGGVIELTPEQMSMIYGKTVSAGFSAAAKLSEAEEISPLSG